MEYAENGSLLDVIKRDGQIEEERAKKWFKELVNAVEYCHENGVVHRYTVLRAVLRAGRRIRAESNLRPRGRHK